MIKKIKKRRFGRKGRRGTAKSLADACAAVYMTNYFVELNILWPNVEPILFRMADYVGDELRDEKDQLMYERILVGIHDEIEQAKKQGKIREKGRDRDILVHFLRGLLRQIALLHSAEIRVNEEVWPMAQLDFMQWREENSGELSVVWKQVEPVTTQALRRIAKHILSQRDWDILDGDSQRLWSEHGDPINQHEFDAEVQDQEDLSDSFQPRLN